MVRNRKVLALLKSKGRISFNHSGDGIKCSLVPYKLGYMLEILSIQGVLFMEQSPVAENQQASLCERSWLGGIMDGEGCLTVSKHPLKHRLTVSPVMTIVNTNPRIIEEVRRILSKYGLPFHVTEYAAKGTWTAQTRISISGFKRITRALAFLRPYLIGKAEQADLIQRLVKSRSTQHPKAPYSELDISLCEEIWRLNGHNTHFRTKASETTRQAATR